jgi:membrane protease YdiL (CAAX protease family)
MPSSPLALALLAQASQPVPLPVSPLPPPPPEVSLAETALNAFAPFVGYLALAPLLYFVFRKTWHALDVEAFEHKKKLLSEGRFDFRPGVLFAITAMVLILQDYYGGGRFYGDHIRPWLVRLQLGEAWLPFGLAEHVDLYKYGELYTYAWWSFARVFAYVVIPFVLWKAIFPKDSLLDMGLRGRGMLGHAWIYLACLAIVVPCVLVVSSAPDFGNYYPFYKKASRSWLDLAVWEGLYFAQFFGLEVFFRGFWLSGLRKSIGSAAIFAMCVPYCMIHFTKPYLETVGALVAGIFLGSLAMRTKSIYSGFLVHITVALLMDMLALHHRGALPTQLFAP